MNLVFIGLFGFLLTALGFFLAFIPWLVVPSRSFTVSVPDSAQREPDIVDLKRRYRNILVIATALLLGGFLNIAYPLSPTPWNQSPGFQTVIAIMAIIDTVILIGIAYGLTVRYRRIVQELKASYRWESSPETRAIIPKASSPIQAANLSVTTIRAMLICFCILLIAFFVLWLFVI